MKPLYTETYTFYVESNDGIRVYVDDIMIIDHLIDSTSDTDTHLITSFTISLTANQLVPIKVMYYETTGVAMISMYWFSTSQTY